MAATAGADDMAAPARDDGSGGAPSSSSSFEALKQCFSRRIDELQELLDLRVDDSALPLFERDLRCLDRAVGDLESTHADLRAQLARERDAAARLAKLLLLPTAAAAAMAAPAQQQAARAEAMAAGLPARLPSLPGTQALLRAGPRAPRLPPMPSLAAAAAKKAPSAQQQQQRDEDDEDDCKDGGDGDHPNDPATIARTAPTTTTTTSTQPPPPVAAPRWYVTAAELQSAPAYLRGPRLTLERVNAAVDEAAALAEATSRLMAAARSGGLARLVPGAEDRRRAAEMHRVASEQGLRGRPWFLDADLRGAPAGAALRPDKSGRALLQVLRHLGRVQEQRVTLECAGGACAAYTLLARGGGGGGGARGGFRGGARR